MNHQHEPHVARQRDVAETTSMLIVMPGVLKAALADAATSQRSNMTDVAVAILAAHYHVSFDPSRRRVATIGSSRRVVLRMPHELKTVIQYDALEQRTNMTLRVIDVLARHLDVAVPPPTNHARRRQTPFGGGTGRPNTASPNTSSVGKTAGLALEREPRNEHRTSQEAPSQVLEDGPITVTRRDSGICASDQTHRTNRIDTV
jgi:hypothetical protein